MRIGIHAAQLGLLADAAAVRAVAAAAEQVGYSSLWVNDRLPLPDQPRSPYREADGMASIDEWPPEEHRALDPFAVLAAAAAVTTKVRLGTSVVVAPWYQPTVLARMLTSLDVLSEGRLTVGIGTGWSLDELEAAGVDQRDASRKLDEVLDVLDAQWSDGPITYIGPSASMPSSVNDLRTVQRPRPPVLIAGSSDEDLERTARRGDGWNPLSVHPTVLATRWKRVRDLAEVHGRDPRTLQLIVRADIALFDRPVPAPRYAYWGNVDQIVDDIAAAADVGADEVILHLTGNRCLDSVLDGYARIAESLGVRV